MRIIRPINIDEIEDFLTISANAYPGFEIFSEEKRSHFRERTLVLNEHPAVHLFALYEDGQMRGCMRLFDFNMKLLSTRTLVGGVGAVAVDLLHKKEKVAADMIRYYLKHYKEQGACLTALYPFRPDFYKRMGFGYGSQMNSYSVSAASLPKGPSKAHIHYLGAADREALESCYDRFVERRNGLMERLDFHWDGILNEPALHIIGVRRSGHLSGYLIYKFSRRSAENFLDNDLVIREIVYESAADLREMLTFLHIQADQVNRIIFNSQEDSLYFLFQDPRTGQGNMLPHVLYHESNLQGVGIMYRIVDVPRLFTLLADHDFNGQNCRLKIILQDSFFPENAGEYVVQFADGRPSLAPEMTPEIEIAIDVSEFSSLLVGAINFARLHEFGLVEISDDAHVPMLDRLFSAPKPICLTSF